MVAVDVSNFDPGKLEHLIGTSLPDQRCVLDRFLAELHEALPAMQAANEAQQWAALHGYVHKYRGTSSVIGATTCAELLGKLETCLSRQQTDTTPMLMACLANAINDLDIAVNSYLRQAGSQ